MMDEYSLMEFADRFKDIRQLERDYLLVFLLHEVYSTFANELIFKGGTAIKYFYNLNRFSEDIDFSYIPSKDIPDRKHLVERFDKIFDSFSNQYYITGKEYRTNKSDKEIIGMNYVIRVKGPLNQKLDQLQNIKIDISLRNDIIFKPDLKYLSPIYPDITTFSLSVMNINEILAEKIAAIIERTKMRDIYDSHYLLAVRKLVYDESLVVKKMHKRKERFSKEELKKKLDEAKNRMKWRSELAYIVNPLPDNIRIISELEEYLGLD